MSGRTPVVVTRAMAAMGAHMRDWRKLNGLTQALVAERAGVSAPTVRALEAGRPVSTETLVRVARALGTLDLLTGALDPMSTEVGRLRSAETLPQRVRLKKGSP